DTTTIGARITVRLQAAISLPPKAEVERLLAMPTLPPSPLASLSPPSAGERLARCTDPSACPLPPPVPSPLLSSSGCPTQIQTLRLASTQALIDAVTAVIPSPPLPPPLYIPPPIDRRDDILEIEMPPRKRLCLSTLGSRYEIEESSTARPTGDRGIDYGFVSTLDAEARRRGIGEAGQGPNVPPNNTNPNNMTPESVQAMIDQALLRNFTNRDGSHSSHEDNRRNIEKMELVFQISGCAIENQVKSATCTLLDAALTWWNSQIRSLGPDAYSMNWEVKGNDLPAYTECFQELTLICTKIFANETEKIDKYVSELPDNIYGSMKAFKPKTLDETIELANDLMDQKLCTYAERQTNNKRKADDSFRNNHGHQQQPLKRKNVAKVYDMRTSEKKPYSGNFPKDCPKLKNKDGGNVNAQVWVYAVGNAEKKGNVSRDPDSNVIMGTFLLYNRYASIFFDTGADRSFISIVFSSLIDIIPTPLGNSYDVELADGKIVRVDTIMRGCTLNFLNHPFNKDLMPIELGSFDLIIGMDWLRRCHVVIMCDEKLVRVPYGNETLIFCGNESNNGRESRLTVISCSKAQKYMAKGCQIFLARISAKKKEDKSEGKQLEDVPIV
nr:hypothetical protein [Tanacetum cinerariifolium]